MGRNISLRGFNDGVHSCGIAIGRNISVAGGSSYSTNSGVIAIGDRIFGTSDDDIIPGTATGPTSGIYIGSAFEKNTTDTYYGVGAMIGKGLKLKNKFGDADNTNTDAFIVGQYNDTNLPDALFAVGCGTGPNNRKTALSISNTKFKVLNDLQLATDSTEVNAITPPQDPNNVIQDDKTLVTKSHLPVAILTTSTSLSDVDPVLDLSSVWSNVRATDNNIRFYVRINGVCYESTICNCKAVDGLLEFQRNAYDSGTNTTDVYEYKFVWDHTNTTLTYSELFHYTLADNGTISNVTHTLGGATITVYGVETF